jgi:nucleoside-diphosphate kinase
MERSLVIIKPDGTVRRRVGALVVKDLLDRGYKAIAFREMTVPPSLAEAHYAVHKDKPFFPWLVQFITSARVLVIIFEGPDVIQGIRQALGATFVQKASPESLRGRYGLWAGMNIAHASDAAETATHEIELWTTQGGVRLSPHAQAQAQEYVATHSRGSIDHTMAIRRLIESAIKERRISSDVSSSLQNLLAADAEGVNRGEIRALTRAILLSVNEEIERSGK